MTGLGMLRIIFLQIEHVEAGHGIGAHVAAVAAHALVAARAEGAPALAGENNDADIGAIAANIHCLNHLIHRERREGVVHLRPVDADFGNAPVLGENDFLELLNRGPLDGFSHIRYCHAELAKHLITFAGLGYKVNDGESRRDKMLPSPA